MSVYQGCDGCFEYKACLHSLNIMNIHLTLCPRNIWSSICSWTSTMTSLILSLRESMRIPARISSSASWRRRARSSAHAWSATLMELLQKQTKVRSLFFFFYDQNGVNISEVYRELHFAGSDLLSVWQWPAISLLISGSFFYPSLACTSESLHLVDWLFANPRVPVAFICYFRRASTCH